MTTPKTQFILTLLFIWSFSLTMCSGQSNILESDWILHRDSFNLKGTLSVPSQDHKSTAILFISGSGPTDRNGNNPFMKNNSLKGLSDSLVLNGYTTLRFDKQGEKDLQVTIQDAKLLHQANPLSSMVLVENLNHVLKDIEGGPLQNQESYNNPDLPISKELLHAIQIFLKNI